MGQIVTKKRSGTIHNRNTNYKNLEIWKIAYNLVLELYPLANSLPDYEERNMSDQLRRAVTSLPLNIAEGASSKFKRTFYSQLNYAYCSSKEVEVILMLCRDLNYVNNEKFYLFYNQLERFKKRTYRLMEKIEKELLEKK
ncbi:four helix bundle protein [Candidatus Woesearchaeota archaeon]|jgi:four helix bundle protein|nr:four helix bundle protein [Candidatus Woesearchaeota archaeon]